MNAILSVSAADVHALTELVPPATLDEARDHRDTLARLLGREREAAADFLLALADFDRRRGWERLGHSSLFAFLGRELGLSNGAAWLRLTAARLLPRFPAVEAALRQGRLCLSAVGELSRVLTEENEADVLPRFFGRSSREAREVAAAILPRPSPPRREVVTAVPAWAPAKPAGPVAEVAPATPPVLPARTLDLAMPPPPTPGAAPLPNSLGGSLRAREVGPTHPSRGRSEETEPLSADLRRLHVTVSARFLEKVAAARNGLSHAAPGATTEQVLEAALDLLLEKQARAKALVRRPRKGTSKPKPAPTPTDAPSPHRGEGRGEGTASSSTSNADAIEHPFAPGEAPGAQSRGAPTDCSTSAGSRHIPAEIEREVRLRDGDRCQLPLDAGGVCGSTWQVQLDHLVPLALGGPTTISNLRCACAFHNRRAAELALGPTVAGARRRSAARSR